MSMVFTSIFLAAAVLLATFSCSFSLPAGLPTILQLAQRHQDQLKLQGGIVGPESIAFDKYGGGPYTGVSDGRIIKWDSQARKWIDFAFTSPHRQIIGCNGTSTKDPKMEQQCGRTLGLQFNKATGHLYIADASLGLFEVGPQGGLATPIVSSLQGQKFSFTNGLDIDQDTGIVYFTDSSTRFHRRDFEKVVMRMDKTGRVMKYDPATGEASVMLRGLFLPNGLAVSSDNSYLMVVEAGYCRVVKVWIKGPMAGTSQVFGEVPGYPDNIKRTPRGGFWVAHSLGYLPMPAEGVDPVPVVAVRIGLNGEVVEALGDELGLNNDQSISEIEERDGKLWIGSVVKPYIGIYKI